MLEIININENKVFGFRVNGQIEKADMEKGYSELDSFVEKHGKIKLYIEVKDLNFSKISKEAIKFELIALFKRPMVIANISKVVLVTDLEWIKKAFAIESALIPTYEGKSFSFGNESAALNWLTTDQRKKSRLNLTISEFAETSALKFAGGFALGLLTAGLISTTQRTNLGKALMIGTVAAGVPLGIKVLNNNRQLLGNE